MDIKTIKYVWCLTPVIPTTGSRKQEGLRVQGQSHSKFEAAQSYMKSCPKKEEEEQEEEKNNLSAEDNFELKSEKLRKRGKQKLEQRP